MKNVITINAMREPVCELVSCVNDGTNQVILEIRSDLKANPKLQIGQDTENIDVDPRLYTIPIAWLTGDGALQFRIVTDEQTGQYFSIAKIKNADGNLVLSQADEFIYEVKAIQPKNETGVPIATDYSLGVVKGGDNVNVGADGTLRANQTGIERMTNEEIDAICV